MAISMALVAIEACERAAGPKRRTPKENAHFDGETVLMRCK
jgi:hypothetical protein